MKYRSVALAGTIAGICVICMNLICTMVLSFGTLESSLERKKGCLLWPPDLICGLSSFITAHASAAWVLPVVFVYLTCHILSDQFSKLTRDFTESFEGVENIEARHLEKYRRTLNILCRSVELGDKMLSPLFAVAYCTNITTIIVLFYQVWFRKAQLLDLFIFYFFIGGSIMYISVLSYSAVTVHQKAHSLRRHVHDLQTATFDPEIAQIQMLFLARLDGPEIGMTALGCFVITKERVLAVISTLITYFTILLQFKGLCPDESDGIRNSTFPTSTTAYTT
ncbi:uncharacterized protein LOC121415160 [Lytechinus variegatus]|uniref:uncharacterized protein LOC121415160 n=1 Tax=Lytechinus variegatus TaxID=7654 RepID=UPI001BB0FF80|nr:uncharacterized protein LOC121415160 [Lytechinus variegatus]